MAPNWKNQTIWTGDNLPIMRGMNSDSVDLIYLDPPFNSKTNYAAPIGSKAAGAAFKDTWTLSDVDTEWINLIEGKHPALYRVLLAAMTDSDKSYLVYMAARLLEMHRLLKPTGSIYLHCDSTMSHYLKIIMDAVFGKENFRNEIVWSRRYGSFSTVHKSKKFGASTDVILYYAKRSDTPFNPQYSMGDPSYIAYVKRTFKHVDENGRIYRIADLANPAPRPNLMYDYKGYPHPKNGWAISLDKMEQWDSEGRLHFPKSKTGRIQRRRFLDELKGKPVQNLWSDIDMVSSRSGERTGYPTQKPLALRERIIKASSDVGDMVIDPFCGCATTLVAADGLKRKWVGIDISEKAADLVVKRVHEAQGLWRKIINRKDLPQRTDLGDIPTYNCSENRQKLYGIQGGNCAGCKTHFETRHLEVDHIISRAKGGTDHIDNLQLLCGNCNRIKGDRGMEYLKVKLQIR